MHDARAFEPPRAQDFLIPDDVRQRCAIEEHLLGGRHRSVIGSMIER
jgi:hypothetical protein